MRHFWSRFIVCSLVALYGSATAGEIDFYREVYPFLKENCISCHNKTTTKAGLNMETPELMIAGGDSGPSIVPGNSADSLLVEASAHSEHIEMPPSKNKTGARDLTLKELALLKQWIDEGAESSAKEVRKVAWQALASTVDPIYTVAMTNDGRFVACGRANQIFLYDLATQQFVTRIGQGKGNEVPHRALVNSLSFSPDGTRLASGSYREIKIWKREPSASAVHEGDPALGTVASVLFSEGERTAAADQNGSLLILDSLSGKVLRKVPEAFPGETPMLAVSLDGEKVAAFSTPWHLSVWRVSDGKEIAAQTTPDPSQSEIQPAEAEGETPSEKKMPVPKALAWSADGKSVLTASSDKEIRVWAVPALGEPFPAPRLLSGSSAPVTSIATGPKGKVVTGGEDNKVRLWNLAEGTIEKEFAAATVSVAFTPDGKRIATATDDGRIRLWDAADGSQLFDLRSSPEIAAKITALQRSIDREKLEQAWQKAQAAKIAARDKGLVDLLKKAKDAVVAMNKKLPEAEKAIPPLRDARVAAEKKVAEVEASLANPPEGKTPAALESELEKAKVALLAAQTKENDAVAALAAFQSNITDAEANQKKITDTQAANQKAVAAANAAESAAKKRETEATSLLESAKKEASAIGSKPLALAFSADSSRLAANFEDGAIRIWSVVSGIPLEKASGPVSSATDLVPGSDGSFVSSRDHGGILITSSSPRWKLERVLGGEEEPELFADRVNAIAFSPDGTTLAAGSGEPSRSGDITLFDLGSGNVTATWNERHSDSVVSLDFSPDGKRLASGAADKIARITEVATGDQVGLFEGHTHYVNDVAFRSDGRVLATAGADGVVNSWDLTMGERKKKIEGWTKEVTSLQFIGATDRIVTSAGDNLVRIVTDAGAQVRAISKLPDFMQAAASTSDGKTIVAGGEDSYLRVWNGSDGKEIVAFGMQ